MLRIIFRLLTLSVVAVLVLSAAPTFAQDEPVVSTPDSPMALTGEWVELGPGQTHIYKFRYKSTVDKFGGGGPKPMSIYFYTQPDGGARLTLRNAEQARMWATQGKSEWFGMATPQTLTFKQNCNARNVPGTGSDYDKECHDGQGGRIWDPPKFAHWEATMAATGDYWVFVQLAPGKTAPVSYLIRVEGPAFQFVGGNR